MSEEAGSGDEPRRFGRLRDYAFEGGRIALAGVMAFISLGFSYALREVLEVKNGSVADDIFGGFALGATIVVGYLTWRSLGVRESAEQASRQRVREAERSFEDALRAGQANASRPDVDEEGEPDAVDGLPPLASSADWDTGRARPGGLALPELWSLTHTRLDAYHEIALAQAKRSFRNAQIAMGLGFALLLAFVFVALNASTTAGAVVAGGLGAVSAALAGYVSRTFVVSQTASAAHLRAYFDQPLEFARYLAAERIIMDGGLDQDQRAEVLASLVQAMVTPPADPTVQANDRGISQ